jgi:CheY-like chemotaxis protein
MKLKNQGYTTKVVTNGQEALKELKAGKYDLMLMDLIMPVMDGFAVLEEMKNSKINVPVIVLSNLGQDEDRAKTKSLGAIDYFVKSNTPIADIVDKVQKTL